MKKINLAFFFAAVLFTGLIWVFLIPLWHTPDEQAHFGQVAYMVERGKIQGTDDKFDSTEEIYISEKLLGTARDNAGNNKFTFHPEYRIEYSPTIIGIHEKDIESLAQTGAKKKFTHSESSRYPKLYYIPATWIYRLLYDQNLFIRVFAIRFWSLLLYVLTIYVVYRTSKLLFAKDKLLQLILTTLVAFQPMFIFSNIGVTSDSLGNLLFALFLYFSTKIIINIKKIDIVLLFITIILSVYTKPQFIVMLPLVFVLALIVLLKTKDQQTKGLIIKGALIGSVIACVSMYALHWPIVMVNQFLSNLQSSNLLRYSWEYTLSHTVREVLPWYWGIYDWLGVTYPRYVHRIINRVLVIACVGLIVAFIQTLRNKSWKNPVPLAIIFQSCALVFYFTAISIFDYLSWQTSTYSLGVQGRYFFPLITTQMLLILIGIKSILPKFLNIRTIGIKILALSMICLNIYALYLVASTYFNVSSFEIFIVQASQYKPWFVKNGYLTLCITLYIIMLFIGVIFPLMKLNNRNSKNS